MKWSFGSVRSVREVSRFTLRQTIPALVDQPLVPRSKPAAVFQWFKGRELAAGRLMPALAGSLVVSATLGLGPGQSSCGADDEFDNSLPVRSTRLVEKLGQPEQAPAPKIDPTLDPERLPLMIPATTLGTRKTIDLGGHTIGKIDDLVLDLSKGQVLDALVYVGGRSQLVPVPARSFVVVHRTKVVTRPEKRSFETAPRIARGASPDSELVTQSERFFGATSDESCAASARQLCTSSGLVGMRVISRDQHALGRVDELMVDLPMGRIVYVVVQPGFGADAQSTRYAVPPAALHLATAQQMLVLDGDAARFTQGPKFQAEFPTDMVSLQFALAAQRNYGLLPADTDDQTVLSASSVKRANRDKSKAIFEEILRDLNPLTVRDVTVVCVNGRFVLSGYIRRQSDIQLAMAAAERIVGAGCVDNRLQTSRTKTFADQRQESL